MTGRARLTGERPILAAVPAPQQRGRFKSVGPASPEVQVALARWERWMDAQAIGARTITTRAQTIKRWQRVTGCDPIHADAEDVVMYLATLPSVATKLQVFGTFRAWFRWLMVTKHRSDEPTALLKAPRVPRRQPRPIRTAHLEAMLAVRMKTRTRTMILLAAYQGLRVHEIAKIRGEDVDLIGRTLHVVGKGRVEAILPLSPVIAAEAAAYPRIGWWFPSYIGTREGADSHVTRSAVGARFARVMKDAGVPGTAHSLRHWYGTELLRAGANLRIVQELMRHASPTTTALYTAVDDDEMASALSALPMLTGVRAAPYGAGNGTSAGVTMADMTINGVPVASKTIRAWARQQGMAVNGGGKLPVAVVDAYRAAHSTT